ncbi:hypothetical protein DFJ73DRAFT_818398 [Zopfochytrium polystomum]|nr:hypothetical protein DFJ73DRAFT_818398 [Zopfochytrium polystomum]
MDEEDEYEPQGAVAAPANTQSPLRFQDGTAQGQASPAGGVVGGGGGQASWRPGQPLPLPPQQQQQRPPQPFVAAPQVANLTQAPAAPAPSYNGPIESRMMAILNATPPDQQEVVQGLYQQLISQRLPIEEFTARVKQIIRNSRVPPQQQPLSTSSAPLTQPPAQPPPALGPDMQNPAVPTGAPGIPMPMAQTVPSVAPFPPINSVPTVPTPPAAKAAVKRGADGAPIKRVTKKARMDSTGPIPPAFTPHMPPPMTPALPMGPPQPPFPPHMQYSGFAQQPPPDGQIIPPPPLPMQQQPPMSLPLQLPGPSMPPPPQPLQPAPAGAELRFLLTQPPLFLFHELQLFLFFTYFLEPGRNGFVQAKQPSLEVGLWTQPA